jgi:tetratricopeptide (TPR) repeat protein
MEYCQLDECKLYFKKFKKAARLGHAGAMATLGQFYYTGYGTQPDESKAITYLKKASRYADSAAQYKLGLIYLTSEKNFNLDAAVKYLEKAAKKDYKDANILLGMVYYNNQFAPQNFTLADKYLSKSYQQRHPQMPAVITNIKAKVSLDQTSFPLLFKELAETPLVVSDTGINPWPADEMEVITITSPPLTQILDENLVAFRRAITATGSRLPGKSCSELVGCYQSIGRGLSGFPPGFMMITDATGLGGLTAR